MYVLKVYLHTVNMELHVKGRNLNTATNRKEKRQLALNTSN